MDDFIIKNLDLKNIENLFQSHKQKVSRSLVGKSVDIQHVGATSVIGLISKGDLDIQIRVSRDDFEPTKEVLSKEYEPAQEENWTKTFASFKDDSGETAVGLQLTIINSEEDSYFYKLRDILNEDVSARESFNQLKREYDGKSMDDYRKAKSKFIEGLFSK
ncbi:MAG TPA: GrpB family protein [Patescibacteria group bacterium]